MDKKDEYSAVLTPQLPLPGGEGEQERVLLSFGRGVRGEDEKPRTFGEKVRTFDEKVRTFGEKVRTFDEKVRTFGKKVRTFDEKVRTFGEKVRTFDEKVRTFDEKVRTFFIACSPRHREPEARVIARAQPEAIQRGGAKKPLDCFGTSCLAMTS